MRNWPCYWVASIWPAPGAGAGTGKTPLPDNSLYFMRDKYIKCLPVEAIYSILILKACEYHAFQSRCSRVRTGCQTAAATAVGGAENPGSGRAVAARADQEVRPGEREAQRRAIGTAGTGARGEQRRNAGRERARADRRGRPAPPPP